MPDVLSCVYILCYFSLAPPLAYFRCIYENTPNTPRVLPSLLDSTKSCQRVQYLLLKCYSKFASNFCQTKLKQPKRANAAQKSCRKTMAKKISFHHQSVPFTLSVFFLQIQKQKEFWQNYVAKARSRTPGLQGPSKVTFINKESTCTVETIPLFLYLLPSGP